jgi:TetR/AcrR family fatty acid metabolism transcriptional regulator
LRTKTANQAEKILGAAARLFAQQRFHEARMEDVAAAAEVGKGTIYRYFKDKEELYLALQTRAADQMSERLRQAVAGGGGPRAKLEAVVATIIDYFDDQPHLFALINHAEVLYQDKPDNPWLRTRHKSIQVVSRLFDEARQCGDFRVPDPELGVLMLLGGLRAVIRFGEQPRPPDLARRLVANFLAGAQPRADPHSAAFKGRSRAAATA